jgi:hypothetical protein
MLDILQNYGVVIVSVIVAALLFAYKFYFGEKDGQIVDGLEDMGDAIANATGGKRGRPRKCDGDKCSY